MILYGKSEKLQQWFAEHMQKYPVVEAPKEMIGCEMNGEVVACATFHHYAAGDIEVELAVDKKATKGFMLTVFRYVFNQLKCWRMTCMIDESNLKSIQLAERLGFTCEGKKRGTAERDSVLIFGLLKSECKYV